MAQKLPLDGLIVLELTSGIAGSYACRLLSHLGADVIKVEAPSARDAATPSGAAPEARTREDTSPLYLYCNLGKRSVALDYGTAAGVDLLQQLLKQVDVFVEDGDPALGEGTNTSFDKLLGLNPALIIASIRPFGLSGPHAGFKAYPLNIYHAGGEAFLLPASPLEAHTDRPPVAPALGQPAEFDAGVAAAVTVLLGVVERHTSGLGQQIDISMQEVEININRVDVDRYPNEGVLESRLTRKLWMGGGLFPCRNGFAIVEPIAERMFETVKKLIGEPEPLSAISSTVSERRAHVDTINAELAAALAPLHKDDIYHRWQGLGVATGRVSDAADSMASEQYRSRGFFKQIDHPKVGKLEYAGLPITFTGFAPRFERAPLLGENTQGVLRELLGIRAAQARSCRTSPEWDGKVKCTKMSPLPLAGIRVLDLTWVYAGPSCCSQLAAAGAEVIKIESRTSPDLTRIEHQTELRLTPTFAELNSGKKSICLNLRDGRGAALARELVKCSDVVVEAFRPGVLQRMGLGYEVLHSINEDIILVSISGMGQSGPESRYAAYASIASAVGGISFLTGYPDGAPSEVRASSDMRAGMWALFGTLAALRHRQMTGARVSTWTFRCVRG